MQSTVAIHVKESKLAVGKATELVFELDTDK